MKSLFVLVFVFRCFVGQAQYSASDLEGSWQCYHKELEDGNTGENLTLDGKPYSCDVVIDLKSDKTGLESMDGAQFTYDIVKDSILQLGNRLYIIEELSAEELVLLDYDPDELSIFNYRQRFKKLTSKGG